MRFLWFLLLVTESCRQLAFERMHALIWGNKTKQRKFSTHCLSPISFCYCSPGTEGLCLTTAQMACERSIWPRWRNALEKHLEDCTSSLLMESWSQSKGRMPPSSSLWKRCVTKPSKPFIVSQDQYYFPFTCQAAEKKRTIRQVTKQWTFLRLGRIQETAVHEMHKQSSQTCICLVFLSISENEDDAQEKIGDLIKNLFLH